MPTSLIGLQGLTQPMARNTMDSAAAYANGASGSIPARQLYAARVRRMTSQRNFWAQFMGAGAGSAVRYEPRPQGQRGMQMQITTAGTLGGVGKMGDNLFTAASQLGQLPLGKYDIYLELISQGTGVTPHGMEVVGVNVDSLLPDELGKWGARYLQRYIDMTALHKTAAPGRFYAGSKGSLNALRTADVFKWSEIQKGALVASSRGALPFKAGTKNGEDVVNLAWLATDNNAYPLSRDSEYLQAVREAGQRGPTNSLFTGEIEMIDGNTIFRRRAMVEQGQVPAGSPFTPIAYLGVADAYNASGTNTTLQGGGNLYDSSITDTPWFIDFPGFQYKFRETETLALADSFWGSGPYYALIVNPPTAATDPGKIGMIAYTVPAGANTLTVTSRLHASGTTAINDTTVGDVVYGGSVLNSTNYTPNYAKGAAIIPCNSYGVPIGAVLGFSREAIGFCRGNYWGELFKQNVQGGMHGEQLFCGWTHGAAPFTNLSGDTPGLTVIGTAVSYPQYNLPTVT